MQHKSVSLACSEGISMSNIRMVHTELLSNSLYQINTKIEMQRNREAYQRVKLEH